MKGLAWYSVIIIGFSLVSLLIETLQGISVDANLWGIVLYIPVETFLVRYLIDKKKNEPAINKLLGREVLQTT